MAQGLIFGSFVIEGMPELLQDIQRFGEEVRFKVSAELRATADKIVRDAKRKAPVNMGALRRGITWKSHDDLNYEQFSFRPFVGVQITGMPLIIASVAVIPHDSYLEAMSKTLVLLYTLRISGLLGTISTFGQSRFIASIIFPCIPPSS